MDRVQMQRDWFEEERRALMSGWDFSHIDGRHLQEALPWDYREALLPYLLPGERVLDLETGGGEFLLSLGHNPKLLTVTEAYPPNVALCRERLSPLGVEVRETDAAEELPFPDESFGLVLNRHGSFHSGEIYRVLKPGGVFVTEQVGAENERELVRLLLPEEPPLPFPRLYLAVIQQEFEALGFKTLRCAEAYRPIRFFDVGALVWFARVLPWEFPGFSVGTCMEQLLRAQARLERDGELTGRIHRFLLVCRKTAE